MVKVKTNFIVSVHMIFIFTKEKSTSFIQGTLNNFYEWFTSMKKIYICVKRWYPMATIDFEIYSLN